MNETRLPFSQRRTTREQERHTFCSCDPDLDLMTFTCEPCLDSLKMYP